MDIAAYAVEAEVEASHWWFVGRRRLFAREIARLGLANDSKVLDIGTSTGTNLRMLRELGYKNVVGLDFSDEAIRYCAIKGLGKVEKGDVCAMPFADESFDLILATDIIEHVDDDSLAMSEMFRTLRPGGRVLITVPTFASLWGLQDDLAHHKRRYRMLSLLDLAAASGLKLEENYYFNFLLFVPIWAARKFLLVLRPKIQSEAQLNNRWLNAILGGVFNADVAWARAIKPPFGVSGLLLASRPIVSRDRRTSE